MKKPRLLVVSHFLPFTCSIVGGKVLLEKRRGHTALFSGIKSLTCSYDVVYVGWPGIIMDEQDNLVELTNELKEAIKKTMLGYSMIPVFLSDTVSFGHYEGFCKTVLWPIFHYILWNKVTDGTKEQEYYLCYVQACQEYANATIQQYQSGDKS